MKKRSERTLKELYDCTEKILESNACKTFLENKITSALKGSCRMQGPVDDFDVEFGRTNLVKVCDICGDSGRETLLAICSCCSDGAEHTYCMREKLDKLPGVDWLCEECKIKKMENHIVDKSETIFGGSKPAFSNQSSQNSASALIPKNLPNLGVFDSPVRGLANGLESSKIISRRQADHVEEIKASEASTSPIETASPRTPVLSSVLSFKSQKIEAKRSNMESSEDQSVNGLQVFHHSQESFSYDSFKGRPQAKSPYRHLSWSVSFGNSIINQNVKQLAKNVHYKQKIKREVMRSKLTNETLVKSINKSASFKNSSLAISNTEPANKDRPFQPSPIIVEKKNSSSVYKTSFRKLADPASISHLKTNRSLQKERNVKSTIESSCLSIVKRSYDSIDLGCNGSKKRILHSSRSMEFLDEKFNSENHEQWKEAVRTGFSAADGSCIKVGMARQHDVLQTSVSDPNDNKIKDSNIFISPRLSSSGGNKTLHLENCNKTGRAAQQRLTGELQGLAYLPSNERSLSKTMEMGNKCEDVVNAMVPTTRMLNKGIHFDKLDKVQVSSAPSTFSEKNIALAKDSGNDNDILKKSNVEFGKALDSRDTVNLAEHPTKSLLVPKANRSSHILSETSPREASMLASTLRISAIPKLEFIWQGSFNVLRSDCCLQTFDGIQAHLSTCASRRVVKIASVIPRIIQLEEVPQTSLLWSLQCQGIVNEEKISLFFFAEDKESYETGFSCLLNKMLKDDLALRGKVGEAELFIFASKMLPACSQQWSMLYYLWGMFIGNRKHCLSIQKNNCESTLGIESTSQKWSSQVVADAKIIQEIPLFPMDSSSKTTDKPLDVIDNPEFQLQTLQLSHKVKIGMDCQDKLRSNGTNQNIGESPDAFEAINNNPVEECSHNECKKRKRHCLTELGNLGSNPRNNFSEIDCTGMSRTVKLSFSQVDNKYDNNTVSLKDDDKQESYTPDLELTLGSKSKTTNIAPPLISSQLPSVDELSALLSL